MNKKITIVKQILASILLLCHGDTITKQQRPIAAPSSGIIAQALQELPLDETEAKNSIATDIESLSTQPEEPSIASETATDLDKNAQDILASIEQQSPVENGIELNFENTDMATVITQIEGIFKITLLTDDIINPMRPGGKSLKGNKVTFRTNKPLSRQEAFNLFLSFLDIADLNIVAQSDSMQLSSASPLPIPGAIFRIQGTEATRKSPIRSEIGTDFDLLPDNDEIIRYVYFIKNSTIESLTSVIEQLRSSASSLIALNEHKGFIITDKAYNIKMLIKIVKELDQTSIPESMSVLKLKRADAEQVKQLYQTIIQVDDKSSARLFTQKKQTSSQLLPDDTKIIAEPRTNSLILLGDSEAIKKIETFIKKHIDIDLDTQHSPIHIHQLKFADAETIANRMSEITQYGKNTPAGINGGVRGEDKYFQPISFTAEKSTNSIIVHGSLTSYLMAKETIEKLDEPRSQVVFEFLILQVSAKNNKSLGTQLRSKERGVDGLLGNNVKFQTSGLFGTKTIQTNNTAPLGANRLLGDLVNLAVGAPIGSTILTLGQDLFGVWGIFQALQTVSNLQIVSNPFITATNKSKAVISIGEERRVKVGETQSTGTGPNSNNFESFAGETAALKIEVTPQINLDGKIVLDLTIDINEFSGAPDGPNSANRFIKTIQTQVTVNDQEVLALGGLIKNRIFSDSNKTPLFGDIPILGWLFKNQKKEINNDHLLILLSSKIIKPEVQAGISAFTKEHIETYHGALNNLQSISDKRDPITSLFLDSQSPSEAALEDFIFTRGNPEDTVSSRKKRRKKNKNRASTVLAQATNTESKIKPHQKRSLQSITKTLLPEKERRGV